MVLRGEPLRYFLASGFLSAVALLLLSEAFAEGSVAVVSAIAGLAPVIATVVAVIFLAEVERVTRGASPASRSCSSAWC